MSVQQGSTFRYEPNSISYSKKHPTRALEEIQILYYTCVIAQVDYVKVKGSKELD